MSRAGVDIGSRGCAGRLFRGDVFGEVCRARESFHGKSLTCADSAYRGDASHLAGGARGHILG